MSKTAIYPGSFDPITLGHLDIIKRAASRIDTVVIAIFDNPDKAPIFSFEERKELIQQSLPAECSNIQIATFTGLLADYAAMNNIHTVVRGLRAVSDFDYEFQMALMNRRLGKDIDTIFFMTDEKYSYLSSSLVKQVCRFGGDIASFVPPQVATALGKKYEQK
ncbi:pantetheine-phosphate adenylyltransferase [bacterium]|nr:pantetheine-phosphate adenylyltransferase [bacterium]